MKARTYFLSLFALVLLVVGLAGIHKTPEGLQCMLGGLVGVGLFFLVIGFCLIAGPKEL